MTGHITGAGGRGIGIPSTHPRSLTIAPALRHGYRSVEIDEMQLLAAVCVVTGVAGGIGKAATHVLAVQVVVSIPEAGIRACCAGDVIGIVMAFEA